MARPHRSIPPLTSKDISRFWAKVDRRGPDECWEWKASRSPFGYGHFGINRRILLTHRVCWTIRNGAIPLGLCVCHRCDNPSCVHPSHLFLATQIQNLADRDRKNRASGGSSCGASNPAATLTENQVRQIRRRYAHAQITQRELAAEYNVSRRHVGRILQHQRWQHVP